MTTKEILSVKTLWKLKFVGSWEGICSVWKTPCFQFPNIIASVWEKSRGTQHFLLDQLLDNDVLRLGRNLVYRTSKCGWWFTIYPCRILNFILVSTCISKGVCLKVTLGPLLGVSKWLSKLLFSHRCNTLWVLNLNYSV